MQRYGDSACMSHLNYVFFPIQSVALLYTSGPSVVKHSSLAPSSLSPISLLAGTSWGEMNPR